VLAVRVAVPTNKVFAFEPDESSDSLLMKNIKTNGYGNVVALNQAVSAFVGHTILALSEFHSGVHHLNYSDPTSEGAVPV